MSSFKYNYVPESELEPRAVLLEPGEAKFEIKKYVDREKDGSPKMTKGDPLKNELPIPKVTLVLTVMSQGQRGVVFDDFTSKTPWKFHQLAHALGVPGLYNASGVVDLDKIIGYSGRCLVKTDARPGYSAKTVIDKYLPHHSLQDPSVSHSDSSEDDEIPF